MHTSYISMAPQFALLGYWVNGHFILGVRSRAAHTCISCISCEVRATLRCITMPEPYRTSPAVRDGIRKPSDSSLGKQELETRVPRGRHKILSWLCGYVVPGALGRWNDVFPPLKRWAFLFRPARRDWSFEVTPAQFFAFGAAAWADFCRSSSKFSLIFRVSRMIRPERFLINR